MADLASLSIKVDSRDISRAKSELDGLSNSAGKAEQSAQKASSAFAGMATTLKAAAAALATFQAASVLVRFSDEATKLTAQLKLATRSTEEFARAQADVQRISRIAQQDINATGVLYARLANSLRDLGANSTQIASVTESVALALKVSGASAQEASSAMLQLSQAFASGVLRGEEFNSVSEAAPRLMRLLADSLNVPIGKLREMAQNGELTADKVANALIPAVDQLRKEAQQTATISGAFTVLRNEVVSFVAELNKITSVGENLQRSVPLWTGALQTGLKGIAIVGLTVKAVFEALGTAIGAIAAAVMFLVNGEFANAANVMKNFAGDVMNMGKGFIDATKAVLDYAPATGAAATTTELLATTTGKADKAAEKAAKSYAKLRETFAAQVQDLMRYIALVQQGVSVEEANLRVQLERQGALQGEIQTIVDLTAERDALTQTIEGEAKARQELADNIEAQRKAALRDAESIEQQAKAQVIANEAYGQTGVALAILTERRNLDRAAELERFAAIVQGTDPQLAEAYMRQAQAIRELADARIEAAGKAEDAERAKKQLENQTKEARKLEDVFRDVGRSLTDSLFRGFESGKGFLRSFKDAVVNSFKSLVVRFAVQPVLSSVVGGIAGALGFSGGANAAGTAGGAANNLQNLTGLAGIAQSITGGVVGTLGSISTAFGNIGFQSGQSFLAGVSNSLQGGVGTFASAGAGSTAFQIGQFAGKALPFLPGVFSLLEGNFVKAATQTAGTAIGLAIGGPIGGAIGSFIGGLFGNSGPKAISTQAVTTLAGGTAVGRPGKAGAIEGSLEGLGTINQRFLQQLDGLLRAAKVGSVGDVQVASELNLFDKRRRGGFNFQVKRGGQDIVTGANDTFGNNVEEIATALAEELLGPALRDAFIAIAGASLTPAVREFISSVETPEEISQRIALVNRLTESQDILNNKFGFTIEQLLGLANAGANVDAVLGGLSGLLTAQEAFDQQVNALDQAFKRLNVAVPESSKALRDLILATDKSTTEGRDLAASLAALAPAFQQIEAAQNAIKANVASAVGVLSTEQERLQKATEILAEEFKRLNVEAPQTSNAFKELIESQDLTAASGLSLANELASLAPLFQEIEAAQNAIKANVASAVGVLSTEQERLQKATAILAEEFKRLNVEAPRTSSAFKELIESQDLTADSGLSLANELANLAPLFQEIEAAQNAIKANVASAVGVLSTEQERLQKATAILAEEFKRLNVEAPRTSSAFKELIDSQDLTAASGLALANELANLAPLFQEIEAAQNAIKANVASAVGVLSTEQERLQKATEVLAEEFKRLNVEAPRTSSAFKELIESQDLTTASGLALANELANLAPLFQEIEAARLQRELEQLNSTIDGLASSLATVEESIGAAFDELLQRRDLAREAVLGLYDDQLAAVEQAQAAVDALGDELRNSAARFDDVIRLMRDFRGELDSIAASSGPAALAFARARFESVTRNAQLGNLDAANQLPDIGRDFLTVSAERSVSREDFLRDLASVRRATEDVEGVALRQKSIAEQQLDSLGIVAEEVVTVEQAVRNLETAQAAAESTRATLERLGVLGEQQGTIEEAIRNLETAEQAVATAQGQLEQSGLLVSGQQTTNELLATIAAGLQERASLQQSLLTAQNQRAELLSPGVNELVQEQIQSVQMPGMMDAASAAAAANLFPGVNELAQQQIESVQMSGMVANASAAVAANQFELDIQSLYQNLLGRAADVGGLQSFVSSNQSLAQIEQVIRQSQEFEARGLFGAAGQNEFNRIVNEALGVELGVEAFANGGTFGGGLRLVGERGPELEFTGPSRIFSNSQSMEMLRPDMSGLERRMESLERAMFQVAKNTGKTSDLLRDWDDGGRMNVRVEATAA